MFLIRTFGEYHTVFRVMLLLQREAIYQIGFIRGLQ